MGRAVGSARGRDRDMGSVMGRNSDSGNGRNGDRSAYLGRDTGRGRAVDRDRTHEHFTSGLCSLRTEDRLPRQK